MCRWPGIGLRRLPAPSGARLGLPRPGLGRAVWVGCAVLGWACAVLGWACAVLGWACAVLGWACAVLGWACAVPGWACAVLARAGAATQP